MLELINIKKEYKSKKHTVNALKGISFKLPEKGLIFITGKSGCGKTTIMNIIGGIDSCDSGNILLQGSEIKDKFNNSLDFYRSNVIGIVFQEYNLLSDFSVYENLAITFELESNKPDMDLITEALKNVELEGYENRRVYELSGGQRQRIAVARAIVKKPKIILADEPTGSLDKKTSEQIFSILKETSKERLVIVVSHDEEAANVYGDRIIKMKDGLIISDTIKNEVIENENSTIEIRKSKLPIKVTTRIAMNAFFHKIPKFLITVILAAMSFGMFAASDAIRNLDKYRSIHTIMEKYDDNYVSINNQSYMTKEEVKEIENKFTDLNFIKSYRIYGEQSFVNYVGKLENQDRRNNELFKNDKFSGFVPINNSFIADNNFSLVGNLAQNENEIVISSYIYEMFKRYGFINVTTNQTIAINKADDLIGVSIKNPNDVEKELLITGILKCSFDMEKYNKLDTINRSFEYMDLGSILTNSINYGYEGLIFVHNKFILEDSRLKNSDNGESIFVNLIANNKNLSKESLNNLVKLFEDQKKGLTQYTYNNAIIGMIDFVSSVFESVRFPLLVTSLVLLGVSIILLGSFISTSINYKLKEVGILRSLGARSTDIFKIFWTESILIAILNVIFASIIAVLLILLFNKVFLGDMTVNFGLLRIGFRQVRLTILISFVVVTISCIIPTLKITLMKPVDIIKKQNSM